jgi:hypothetical protein
MPYRRTATRSGLALETPLLERRAFATRRRSTRQSGAIAALLFAAAPVIPVAISTAALFDSFGIGLICGGLAFVTAAPMTARVVSG